MKWEEMVIDNSENLPSNFKKIVLSGAPNRFDEYFLKGIGFTQSEGTRYPGLFRGLGLINWNCKPSKTYHMFISSVARSREVIAKRIFYSYSNFFNLNPSSYRLPVEFISDLYKLPVEIISDLFRNLLPEQDEQFLYKFTSTFKALIDYSETELLVDLHRTLLKTEKPEMSRPVSDHEEFLLELLDGAANHDYKPNSCGTGAAEFLDFLE